MIQENIRTYQISKKSERELLIASAIGAIITILGIVFDAHGTYPQILLAMNYIIGLSTGAVAFLAMLYLSNAGWGAAIKRIPEAMTGGMLIGVVLLIFVFFGMHHLYEWTHENVVAVDQLLQKKTWWLNKNFFIFRSLFYIFIWYLLARAIVRNSIKQDEDGNLNYTFKNRRLSVAFAVVFALTGSLASFDWLMSLEPHWYSTIFGLYNLTGTLVSALSAILIFTILLRRSGVLDGLVHKNHLHDLAKLIFAFSTFWAYLFFCQYLLIWYANIPEEVGYLIKREAGSWGIFTIMNLLFNWVIPFFVLLPKAMKKNEGVLLRIATILLIGRWIDLFWMIAPPFMPNSPLISIWSVGPILFAIPLFFVLTFRAISKNNLIPKNDPMLIESVSH